MNILVNRLPSITWNHLHMNESPVNVESEYTVREPQAEATGEISWNYGEKYPLPAIKSGMGKDMQALTAEAGVGLAQTKEGVKSDKPIIIKFNYEEGEKSVSRVILHAEKNSVLNAVLLLTSPDAEGLSAVRTELYADEGAVINIYAAQLLGKNMLCLNDISGIAETDAKINLIKLELGAGRVYAGTEIALKGERSCFYTDLAYHVMPGQKLDMNYVATHTGRRSECLMEVNGTLEDKAEKLFRGSIDFKRGCAGAKGTENENVLLLSDEVVNQTIPLILCQEEDVEGNHGASIGKLDEKILFYLGSRGIGEKEAQQMIARSRIDAVCQKFPVEDIQNEIREFESKRGSI